MSTQLASEPAPSPGPASSGPASGPFRRTWRVVGAGFAVCILIVTAVQVVGVLSLDSSVLQRSVPADGLTSVVIRADHGTVEVIGTDTDEVRVEARVRRSLVDADVDVRRNADRVVVRGTCPGFAPGFCSVDLVVFVPAATAVEVQGRDGDIQVRGVAGALLVGSDDGDVAVEGAGGPVGIDVGDGDVRASGLVDRADVTSDNGGVVLTFAAAPPTVSVASGDGDVEVVVPDGPETYRVDASTGDGEVDTRVRTDPASARTLVLRSGNGSLTVRYPA